MDNWLDRLDACANEFSPEALKSARNYLSAAVGDKHKAMVTLAALSLGCDVWQPKTPGEQLRHDMRTYIDQLDGIGYAAKRKRKPLGDTNE